VARLKTIIAADYDELSGLAAKKVAEYIKPDVLICFAAGDTPLGMFRELIAMQNRGEVDLCAPWYAGLDEWVGLGPEDKGSCVKVMTEAFYRPAGIPKERIRLFDGLNPDTDRQCREMEDWIATKGKGGISFTLLGIGMNGHIGFNEPGTPDISGCFVVDLDDTTKAVSQKYFGMALPVCKGITIGWRTLFDADTVILMASGDRKSPVVNESLKGPVSLDVPASLFQKHGDITAMLDEGAAALL
jgi:glucosamine-6-phosphate isomerase